MVVFLDVNDHWEYELLELSDLERPFEVGTFGFEPQALLEVFGALH